MTQILQRYKIGTDFTEEEYHRWLTQLQWWCGEKFANVEDPKKHAEKILLAALNGAKLDGTQWTTIPNDFFKRVKQLSGFDLKLGIGIRDPLKNNSQAFRRKVITNQSGEKTENLPPIDMKTAMELRNKYIEDLIKKYPHLDNPIYKPKVEELSETIVKSRMISNDFLTATGRTLELLSKIRESLHKQIGELMEFLEISPKQRVSKILDQKNADLGSLIAKMESYGEYWKEYERIDSLRELIQLYHMLKSNRPDNTPQLNDWELWHMTRNRPIKFTCRHGETYELLGGFTVEEIEKALLQAQKTYGWGLEEIGAIVREEEPEIIPALEEVLEEIDNEPVDDFTGENT